jgi:AAA+ ATPase superfamily predicted ATPase
MKFINRKSELDAIKAKLNGPDLDLYVIYGRRRIGKTTLALASVKGKDFIYYLATEENWFRFINPNITFIEEAIFSATEIKAVYNRYLGHVFENVCREFLIEKQDSLPFRIQKIGGQWGAIPKHEKGRNQYEL